MRDSSDQKADGTGREHDEIPEFDVEISDLPPDRRSHFLLLKLVDAQRRGQAAAQTFVGATLSTFTAGVERNDEKDPRMDEQFALEISDLPPSTRSHYLLLKLTALRARVQTMLPFLRSPVDRPRAPLTRARRRMRIGRALTALGLCAVLVLLLVGNVPDLRAQLLTLLRAPAPASTPVTSTSFRSSISIFPIDQGVPIIVERHGPPASPVQATPGPLPMSCPQASNLEPFMTPPDPTGLGGGLSGGLGGGPLWLTGFAGPTAALVDLQPLATSLSQGHPIGWYESLTVFMLRSFLGTVT